jgi:hypothetical protein
MTLDTRYHPVVNYSMRFLFIVAALLLQEVVPPPAPPPLSPKLLPPDLLHLERPSCTIVEHEVAEVFDAKTKEPKQVYHYRVEPYAEYKDHRDRWELPKETMTAGRELRPGAIGEFSNSHEAIDACDNWMKAVRAAQKVEVEKMGHSTKK